MRCDIVNSTHNDITLNNKIYEYLQDGESYMYHIYFKNEEGKY